ncbi:MAG: tRNA (adenosine(37)-N6)-threonylcarbamoyltransferase complex ATPase subunit type 1 TsaE [Saprospiraceae bacterium]|nr:tRNA (adenosine(37)-N6)-threonylcarbamoyltransferase complex ATPase subunit type 1 TsaE [Saprospiraceae bacterium]
MNQTVITFSEAQLPDVAKQILTYIKNDVLILLKGQMGAGKTSLVRAICNHLGCDAEVGSPTFSIVNEYHCKPNPWSLSSIIHMDLYRLNKIEDVIDLGLTEYFESEIPVLIEWPEIAEPFYKGYSLLQIHIEVLDNQDRKIILTF